MLGDVVQVIAAVELGHTVSSSVNQPAIAVVQLESSLIGNQAEVAALENSELLDVFSVLLCPVFHNRQAQLGRLNRFIGAGQHGVSLGAL